LTTATIPAAVSANWQAVGPSLCSSTGAVDRDYRMTTKCGSSSGASRR
jgi:hypothetical protein